MRFLADVGVSQTVKAWLLKQGHDVEHLADLGLERLTDPLIFSRAGSSQRIILTFDLDFGEILARSKSANVSVILFRLADATAPTVIARLTPALSLAATDLEQGAIVVVEDRNIRVRRLPIGK